MTLTKQQGFTLIELLVSVGLAGVVGLIVAGVARQLNTSTIQQRFEARVEEQMADLNVKLAKKSLCESNFSGESATQADVSPIIDPDSGKTILQTGTTNSEGMNITSAALTQVNNYRAKLTISFTRRSTGNSTRVKSFTRVVMVNIAVDAATPTVIKDCSLEASSDIADVFDYACNGEGMVFSDNDTPSDATDDLCFHAGYSTEQCPVNEFVSRYELVNIPYTDGKLMPMYRPVCVPFAGPKSLSCPSDQLLIGYSSATNSAICRSVSADDLAPILGGGQQNCSSTGNWGLTSGAQDGVNLVKLNCSTTGNTYLDEKWGICRTMALGGSHGCALANNGQAYCWGTNTNGQVGDSSTTARSSPVVVSGSNYFTSIATGDSHTCALGSNGSAYCWGLNTNGQLGDGSTTQRTSPTQVAGGRLFVAIAAGGSHSCGLESDGDLYCWGLNTNGQLGDASTTQRTSPTAVSAGSVKFREVNAGNAHTCALTIQGQAYCWGDNTGGKLGDASTTQRTSPVAVSGARSYIAIDAGNTHTCALLSGGQAQCWGKNDQGQLGDTTTTDRSSPVAVSGGRTFVDIAAGNESTCAAEYSGKVYCFGDNQYGQLANGNTTDQSSAALVSSSYTAIKVAAGGRFHCELSRSGNVYCFGFNTSNQLGDGSATTRTSPVTLNTSVLMKTGCFKESCMTLSAGTSHTCALNIAGDAYCWGLGTSGQLGQGASSTSNTATKALGPKMKEVSLGANHSCGLTQNEEIACWGASSNGELGTGYTAAKNTPQLLDLDLRFKKIAAGGNHSCALSMSGRSFCWGLNTGYQFGNNSTTSSNTPTMTTQLGQSFIEIDSGDTYTCAINNVRNLYCWGTGTARLGTGSATATTATTVNDGRSYKMVDVSATSALGCALTTAGAAFCWGTNGNGQVGDGTTTTPRNTPVAVTGSHVFTDIAVGESHACGVKNTGALFCWGLNTSGQLGDTTTTQRTSPTAVAAPLNTGVVAVVAGQTHTCALKNNNTIYCFGNNASGQVGNGVTGGTYSSPTLVAGSQVWHGSCNPINIGTSGTATPTPTSTPTATPTATATPAFTATPTATPTPASTCGTGAAKLAATTPVTGSSITSVASGDTLCSTQFGVGWRWLSWQDCSGTYCYASWGPAACIPATRGWITINDTNGECFSSGTGYGLTYGASAGAAAHWIGGSADPYSGDTSCALSRPAYCYKP